MYVVYILKCSDESYYTGLTDNMDERLWQHQTGYYVTCYTYKRRPVTLLWHQFVDTAEEAISLEKQIKGWSRNKKEALMENNFEELVRLAKSKK
jgi:putative endonuclease